MTTRHVNVIDRTAEQANIWINDVADEFATDDRHEAYRILRAFLHAVRDRITVEQAAQLAAQLPTMVRGVFYEGWRPHATPQRYHDRETFLRKIVDEALLAGTSEASHAATATLAVLRRHVSAGEIDNVLVMMPAEIRELLDSASGADR